MTQEQQKFYNIKHYSNYKTVGKDVDYAVIVDHEQKTITLLFEESDSRSDWFNNLSFLPWPLKLENKTIWTTHGYARAYSSAQNKPMDDFVSAYIENPDYKTIIQGWSFGSAMAKIAALHFITKANYKNAKVLDELTTFGDVKCFLTPFINLDKNINRHREYITANDLVTWCVPFYHRTKKCKVGDRFRIRKAFKTEYYHTHYEEYDYSDFE